MRYVVQVDLAPVAEFDNQDDAVERAQQEALALPADINLHVVPIDDSGVEGLPIFGCSGQKKRRVSRAGYGADRNREIRACPSGHPMDAAVRWHVSTREDGGAVEQAMITRHCPTCGHREPEAGGRALAPEEWTS